MKTIRLTLPYPPGLNHLHAVVRGRKVLSREGRAFKQAVEAIAMVEGVRPIASGPVVVTVKQYRPRRAGDLDNFFKAPFDALKGVAWGDDKQVRQIHAFQFEDRDNPRIEVTVEPLAELTTRGGFRVTGTGAPPDDELPGGVHAGVATRRRMARKPLPGGEGGGT